MRKIIATFGLLTFISCGESQEAIEKVCGPCPDVANGDLAVTGSAQVDGFFKALNIFQSANARLSGEFQGHLDGLAKAFLGAGCGEMSTSECATAVKAAIEADLAANVSGGLRITYVEPKCSASVNVMVEAQAECTAEADVDCTPPSVDPGSVEVSCEGQCTGGCSGSCSGSCAVEVTGGSCSGSCEGGCDLTVAGACSGTCHGTCSGSCTLVDAQGNCKGECTGDCTGNCELAVAASCSGSCSGKCVAPMASASCEGECRGECDLNCTGGCEGSATPPTVTPPDCDAEVEANCNASASAQASASLQCTPPRLDIDFDFSGKATGQAAFLARLSVLRVEMIGVIQGLFNARILVEGDAEANIPAIQDVLSAQIEGAADLTVDDFAGITPYGAICAAAALLDAAAAVVDAAGELGGTVTASAEVAGSIGI